jgi:L-aspartate oxidase
MGGIVSDLWGKTSLENLSVVGECASTGAHGANRLASNSLLESVVFGARVADDLRGSASSPDAAIKEGAAPPRLPDETRAKLRALMDSELGVERSEPGLSKASDQIAAWAGEFGAANELITAGLIAEGARPRKASVGAHYRSDFPTVNPGARTFLTFADLGWDKT